MNKNKNVEKKLTDEQKQKYKDNRKEYKKT